MKINEIFGPTIQGEGKTAGMDCVFIRTAGCNLSCVWCDAPYAWNWNKYDKNKETREMSREAILEELRILSEEIRNVVISGGEPLLNQRDLHDLVFLLKRGGYRVEIETNATIVPCDNLITLVSQWNCSPKLSNSGVKPESRENSEALMKFNRLNSTFKFVVKNAEDVREARELAGKYSLREVYLMPEGRTKKEQEYCQGFVKEMAREYGFEFSPRLHILMHGNKRGI